MGKLSGEATLSFATLLNGFNSSREKNIVSFYVNPSLKDNPISERLPSSSTEANMKSQQLSPFAKMPEKTRGA